MISTCAQFNELVTLPKYKIKKTIEIQLRHRKERKRDLNNKRQQRGAVPLTNGYKSHFTPHQWGS